MVAIHSWLISLRKGMGIFNAMSAYNDVSLSRHSIPGKVSIHD